MTIESILAAVRTLPVAEQIRLCDLLIKETRAPELATRREAIKQAKGSMAGLLPSTEEFLAEKQAELEAEANEAR